MSGPIRTFFAAAATLAAVLATVVLTACNSTAYCFTDCAQPTTGGTGGAAGTSSSTGMGGGCIFGCGTTSTGTGCSPTNGGKEICDGIDNDCDGIIDNHIDFTDPHNCGTCALNCFKTLLNTDPTSIKCDPGKHPGMETGTCSGSCAQDYWDLDCSGSCKYACVKIASDDKTCDGIDDDCDGLKDEDVDRCGDLANCGACNNKCVAPHATPECLHKSDADAGAGDAGNDSGMPEAGAGDAGGDAGAVCVPVAIGMASACDATNTQCAIAKCDCVDASNCWWDIDKLYGTGCEYSCFKTNGGVEICDGLDNDCNGKIDDDLSQDPLVGKVCFGAPDGICADPAHAGVKTCTAGAVICAGANVLIKGQLPETCNAVDDDCNGVVDDNLTDTGGPCGKANLAPCQFGSKQCMAGMLLCIGAIDPTPEVCNGIDDDCDGFIDSTGGVTPPADSVGSCPNPPPPAPPPGLTSPCKAGQKACIGGGVQCVGYVGPTSAIDTCGVDANCNGQKENQPDLMSDVSNCGACGNDCTMGAVHSIWTCMAGQCQFQGCQTNYWDVNNNKQCSYACAFVSAQEQCNGIDDNCNGQIDENVPVPSPAQVCGTSPSAVTPECTSGVQVACVKGGWTCTFPAGVCNPTCASAVEICDTVDNNCNGTVNEGWPNYGSPCASDDAKPVPGDGACRVTGTYVCNTPNSTVCGAVKADCAGLPGGCTELCDGIDNDCDGLIDEPFSNKGSNAAFFVAPAVTKIETPGGGMGAAIRWVYSFEASRPSATNKVPGTGDGYFCSAGEMNKPGCSNNTIPSTPVGVTLDMTPACSVPAKIPWFNVTPVEAQQTCDARGGYLCSISDWQLACKGPTQFAPCTWGYAAPPANACTTGFTASKYCNLAQSYDFDPIKPGSQIGLLPTGSPLLGQCWTDWVNAFGNTPSNGKIFDITGNLREIVSAGNSQYNLLGGAYDTADDSGATCNFSFYNVTTSFQFYDTGFRCCFTQDPTL